MNLEQRIRRIEEKVSSKSLKTEAASEEDLEELEDFLELFNSLLGKLSYVQARMERLKYFIPGSVKKEFKNAITELVSSYQTIKNLEG